MISYRQARKRIVRAERARAVRDQVRAELDSARAHYEAIAAGGPRGYFDPSPERAAELLAAWDSRDDRVTVEDLATRDLEPAHLRMPSLPPLWLQVLLGWTSFRHFRGVLRAIARGRRIRFCEQVPQYVDPDADLRGRRSAQDPWLSVCAQRGPPAPGWCYWAPIALAAVDLSGAVSMPP